MDMLVEYSFLVGLIGMAAGTLYFILIRSELSEEYRSVATIGAVITFIAAINYYFMRVEILEGGVNNFPTQIRYIDWLMTTPLLLLKFPNLLGIKNSSGLVTKLLVAVVSMIILGYFGEVDLNAYGFTTFGLVMFILSCIAWLYIIYLLYTNLAKASEGKPEPIRKAFVTMRYFIVIGWGIYPLGYLIAMIGGSDFDLIREVVYTYADLINKVGFGLVAVLAVKAISVLDKA